MSIIFSLHQLFLMLLLDFANTGYGFFSWPDDDFYEFECFVT